MTHHTSVEIALYERRLHNRSVSSVDVKSLRERLGWTQEQLAEHLGLDRSSVSRMENGQAPKGPTRRLLETLAEQSGTAASTAEGAPAQ